MTQKIDFGGKEFISAKEAARITGYTSDYVGQLWRGGKIQSRMVGRVWFVNKDSILCRNVWATSAPALRERSQKISCTTKEVVHQFRWPTLSATFLASPCHSSLALNSATINPVSTMIFFEKNTMRPITRCTKFLCNLCWSHRFPLNTLSIPIFPK